MSQPHLDTTTIRLSTVDYETDAEPHLAVVPDSDVPCRLTLATCSSLVAKVLSAWVSLTNTCDKHMLPFMFDKFTGIVKMMKMAMRSHLGAIIEVVSFSARTNSELMVRVHQQ